MPGRTEVDFFFFLNLALISVRRMVSFEMTLVMVMVLQVEQLHKIFKLCGSPSEDYWVKSRLPHATIFKPTQPYKRIVGETFKEFPQPALALLETLLSVNPDDRGTATAALKSEVLAFLRQ